MSLFLGLGQSWKKERCEDSDDSDDYQQLDQGESG